jgi:hypothetical protein
MLEDWNKPEVINAQTVFMQIWLEIMINIG